MNRTGITAALARSAREIAFDRLPDEVVTVAKHCVLDWLGVTLAGSREPLAAILREEIGAEPGLASLLGCNRKTSALSAALANGAASHALDFDDTHLVLMGHPTAPVLPAVLALAEERGSSGASLLGAFVAGVEVECRLAALLGRAHYAIGWHSTATLGVFGAAAACAHLLGLDEERFGHAFGLAATQAAGLKSVFGTMSKPFQVGKAAMNGLLAARLAARGFTSEPAIVEVPQGFAATHSPSFDLESLGRLGERFVIRDTLFKYHASCYLTHASIEGLLALRAKHAFDAAAVERVELFVPPAHLRVCNIQAPRTGLEGKFSLRATAAMALLGDDTGNPGAYTDGRMASGELCALRERVSVVTDDRLTEAESRVVVRARNRTFEERFDAGIPTTDLARQGERLGSKFFALSTPVIGRERAARLHGLVGRLEHLERVGEITASL